MDRFERKTQQARQVANAFAPARRIRKREMDFSVLMGRKPAIVVVSHEFKTQIELHTALTFESARWH